MAITIRPYKESDLTQMIEIWNEIVETGDAFPQEQPLTREEAESFFKEQSYTGIAEENSEILGLYILHPNNVGRCGHIANASYAVKSGQRGKRIGEKLVVDSIHVAEDLSFRILQFNAVVVSNKGAIHLYKKLGFTPLGVIPGGFKQKDGSYVDILPFYIDIASYKDKQ
ncbi:GNAT family N-acetyltransferase [Gracilibacillus alcaliphilus]|uniref:GNAT family N-acetyltransferase n=1 Tax=Gracilibacillus alcaliphilus TaxID=1401441 RepID=UPI00195B764B|nr:GNAT family N-acetyltransferase [Gracilibacillus alcaliphilus]MBM7677388.1 L-amino acid N-acyltransferase YncA [Gracilibacillus alcaliphilus]